MKTFKGLKVFMRFKYDSTCHPKKLLRSVQDGNPKNAPPKIYFGGAFFGFR